MKRKVRIKISHLLYIGLVLSIIIASCVPRPTPGPYPEPYPGPYPYPYPYLPLPDIPRWRPIGPELGALMLWPDGSELAYVPAGDFTMGGIPDQTEYLDGFWIQKSEVTNRMYALCVDAGICRPPALDAGAPNYRDPRYGNRPVVNVNWEQAATYCWWITGQLPAQIQWEKAACGPARNTYPWGEDEPTCELLNFNNCFGNTADVGSFPSGMSFYGAFDMAGNVFEWVGDWNMDTETRSVRSSGFLSGPDSIPSAFGFSLTPDFYNNNLGFRCNVTSPVLYPPFCQTTSYQPRTPDWPGLTRRPPGECEPPDFAVSGTFRQGKMVCVNLDFNQPVENPEDYNVTANGEPMECTGVAGAPNRLSCCSGRVGLNTWTEITVCGPDCPEIGPTYPGGEPIPGPDCPPGYFYNRETNQCEYDPFPGGDQNPQCPEGYYYDTKRQTCLPIPGGDQTPDCPEGYYFDTAQQTCVPRGNQTPDCLEGYTFAAAPQTCEPTETECPESYYFDPTTGACQPVPTGNQCPPGFYYDEKRQTCIPVPGGNQTPECPEGYYYNPNLLTCVPGDGQEPDCPEGFTFAAAPGTCEPGDDQECPDGYYYDTGQQTCLPIPGGNQDCPPTFTAAPGYGCLPDPGDDGSCPPGYYFDTGAQACVPSNGPSDCFNGFTYLPNQTRLCYQGCPPGYTYNQALGCCEPSNGNDYPDCPVGYYYDTRQESCVPGDGNYPNCPEGYYYDTRKETCVPGDNVPDCPPGQYYDAYKRKCVNIPTDGCPPGYYYDEKRQTCLPVPGGNQTPQCPDGYYYEEKRQTCLPVPGGDQTPGCPEGYYYDTGRQTCLPIPGGNQAPECPPGYYYDTGRQSCLPYPGNEQTPPCPEGYYPGYDEAGQLICIPVSTQCPEGYYYDTGQQTCLPRSGQTPECPPGYYYDEKLQICLPGTRQPGNCFTIRVYLQVFKAPTPTPVPQRFNCYAAYGADKTACSADSRCQVNWKTYLCENK